MCIYALILYLGRLSFTAEDSFSFDTLGLFVRARWN